MQPLARMPREGVAGVLADIDDTITTEGRLTPEAYAALGRLHDAGLIVVPITGRPAGWCDHIARMWPVSGVVGENGAFWMRFDGAARKLVRRFLVPDAERAAQRARLDAIAQRILAEVPGCALASDQRYREADVAIDFREDVPPLPDAAIDRIVALMEAEGMTAKVSSIHVNGWFGRYDKLGMTRTFLAEAFGVDLDADPSRFVFAGDSPNDAPMFAYFPRSVGVANVRDLIDRIAVPPAYVASRRGGDGFVELADHLLASGSAPHRK
ncbi:MAG: haloacid dehalogenase [Betaproteobacteria bacterium]|nr:MAG: haloacid dehalogenase [Betaproteobacteria bacterium]